MTATILQKCYTVWDINHPYYSQEIYAESAGKAKVKYLGDATFLELKCKRNKEEDIVQIGDETGKLSDLQYSLEWKKWRQDLELFGQQNMGKECYIWSGQWQSYWRANAGGYTNQRDEAGVYEVSDAVSRVLHCGLEKKIQLLLTTKQ